MVRTSMSSLTSVVANPPRVATLDLDRSYSNASGTSFTFTVPSDEKNLTMMLWSMSRVNPENAAVNAPLLQHTWHALEIIDFSKDFDPSAAPAVSKIGAGFSKAMKLNGMPSFALIAHVICGGLVTMLVLPGGVVVPRITRGISTNQNWFRFHMINQGLVALGLVIAAFAIALNFGGELDTTHRRTGVALLVLVILQGLLGCFAHFYVPGPRVRQYTFMTKRGRGPSNFIHVALGIIVVSVGWSSAWTGLTDEWTRRGHGVPDYGFRVGWGILIMVWMVSYFLGVAVFLPRQLQIESKQRAWELKEQKKFFPSEFDLKTRNQPITPTPPLPQHHDIGSPAAISALHSPNLSFPGSPRDTSSPDSQGGFSSPGRHSVNAFRTRAVLPKNRGHQSESSRSGTSEFSGMDRARGEYDGAQSPSRFARSEVSGPRSDSHSHHVDGNPFMDSTTHLTSTPQQPSYSDTDYVRDLTFGDLTTDVDDLPPPTPPKTRPRASNMI